ncbi:MAG: tyrosine-type recombinase/integrase [Roseburia sp.]|uniref:tyrosine-type recombinase/integrase n=1 Tax=Roseburia hominis TaxID=301301 RepID=UPI001F2F3E1B|nr:tyrosine-type recombinase/integrase [Roseburia hominis]MDY4839186.1 tyrosine-type recombinase/integrase [Lachnospiraceae bacterium]
MGKDSEYYKDKKKQQTLKFRELLAELPGFAVDYLYDKEVSSEVSTLISYAYDLLTFFRYLKDMNPRFKDTKITDFKLNDMQNLVSEDIVEYQRYLELNEKGEKHENGKKAIARKMSPLRGMFQYHFEHGYLESNPMALVKLPRLKKDKNIIRMNETEIDALLDAIEHGNEQMSERQRNYCKKTMQRDLAILTLMLGTGIRVSECAGLDLNDINFSDNSMTIVRKGGGQDVLYFGDEIADVLETYINGERSRIIPVKDQEGALFYSLQNKRISVDAIENLVKKYAKIAVPTKKITPHKLRSTYGTALYRETGDIRLVADVLGHENVNTTIDYYAAIEDEHKRQAANAVSVRKKH